MASNQLSVLLSVLILGGAAAIAPSSPAECVWNRTQIDAKCEDKVYTWDGAYPTCALFQDADRKPIPCQGQVGAGYCRYEGEHANSTQPRPASWHVHVFFPNPQCNNCTSEFTTERQGFTFEGAMLLRRDISSQLNLLTQRITGRPPRDPIDSARAHRDPSYNQCGDAYHIVAGAPGNFHSEPCIFEVDAVKEGGPFTDPKTGAGYPNYSFFIPAEFWLPGLLDMVKRWLRSVNGEYDVLIHPNSGCEVRDHAEDRSIEWLGTGYTLLTDIFSCNALGCNQACPAKHGAKLLPPANCSDQTLELI